MIISPYDFNQTSINVLRSIRSRDVLQIDGNGTGYITTERGIVLKPIACAILCHKYTLKHCTIMITNIPDAQESQTRMSRGFQIE